MLPTAKTLTYNYLKTTNRKIIKSASINHTQSLEYTKLNKKQT